MIKWIPYSLHFQIIHNAEDDQAYKWYKTASNVSILKMQAYISLMYSKCMLANVVRSCDIFGIKLRNRYFQFQLHKYSAHRLLTSCIFIISQLSCHTIVTIIDINVAINCRHYWTNAALYSHHILIWFATSCICCSVRCCFFIITGKNVSTC